MAKEVEITGRAIVKPSSPTSLDCKILKFSLIDQFAPYSYTPLVLFYHCQGHQVKNAERSEFLKASLSTTLSQFYPLAGRIKENAFVECVDHGAEYTEAQINCHLSEFLNKPNLTVIKQLLPAEDAADGCLLLVQVTFFDCGGIAIGVCLSHKLADAATFSSFIKCWANTARNSATEVVSPVFVGASIFPPMDFLNSGTAACSERSIQQKCITRRFVFDASKIAALRAKVSSTNVPEPTRVESVAALLWKCAMSVTKSNSELYMRPSIWVFSINLRKRFVPPLPENHAGNYIGFIMAQSTDQDGELEVQNLAGRIRKELQGFGENYVKNVQGEGASKAICGFAKEFWDVAMDSNLDVYSCTSWCKYDLYDADFGWGKPTWISSASMPFKNAVVLMDTRDGNGIEAWLTLNQEDMTVLESTQELLEFAKVNPSISLA